MPPCRTATNRVRSSRIAISARTSPLTTSTPASIYAEFIVEGRIAQKGMICPEELPREVRDAFIAEMGVRNMPVFRKLETAAN